MSQFVTLNSIIGNGKSYRVPIYQRDYAWRANEEVEELWNDIIELEKDSQHYMGYLVLLPLTKTDDSFEIIDGQQRLTTISLLALAVVALLKKWAEEGIDTFSNEERSKEEIRRYIGNVDTSAPATKTFLRIIPKLTLNRNNNTYYKSYLLNLRQPTFLSDQKPSIRLLQQAYDFLFSKLEEKFGSNKSGVEITQFLEKTVGNGLLFTVIEVPDDLEAYKIFESLNARGLQLSLADLLKNYLFSLSEKNGFFDLEEAEIRWQNISDKLAHHDISTFIHHYWNSKYKLTRQTSLLKAIKSSVTDAETAFHFLDALEKQVAYYSSFDVPSDSVWSKEERKHLQVLNLLGASTSYSLFLAYLENLPRKGFSILLREISVISLRYGIAQLNPNEAEALYSSVANQIYEKKLTDVKSIVVALKSIYVADKNFETAFSTAQINTKRKRVFVKYLLMCLENQIGSTEYSYEDSKATIEHILPEKPGSVWSESFVLNHQNEYIYRFGNYTLLNASVNNKLNNETPFSEKIKFYHKSNYKLSSEYCDYDDFTPNTLQLRQDRFAKIAKSIWKSAFIE